MGYNPFYNIENPQLMGYEYAWTNFMKGHGINDTTISPAIFQSWERCRDRRTRFSPVDPEGAGGRRKPDLVTAAFVEDASGILRDIFRDLESDCFYGIITDRTGRKLFGLGTEADKDLDRLKRISEIDSFAEERIGTNCFSLALELRKAYCVAGAQHYFEPLHKYAGYAAPVLDVEGQMVGMVGLYTLADRMDAYIISFVTAVERAIENALKWRSSQASVEKQREEKQYILDTVSDGVVYVDDSSRIIHGNRRLFDLFGVKEDVVGGDISQLVTTPPIAELKKYPYSSICSNCDNKISIINHRGESRQCFFNRYKIAENGEHRDNEVWVFTVYSDIKKWARKLSGGNTSRYTFHDIKSNSQAMKSVIELAKKSSTFEAGTIIEGDSGTGKEMLAQAIHSYGPRKNGPFIAIDCGALPSGLLESELFGYEEGAFTGAKHGGKKGKFELANKGILFLDEITNMPYDIQAKLLRVLQERKIVPIGGAEPIEVDVQIIAATNKDIVEEIALGNFRQDLFYRLNLLHIKLPALKERENDLQIILEYFLHKYSPKGNRVLDKETVDILSAYDWPGNIRQLENVIERMTIISNSRVIGRESIPDEILKSVSVAKDVLAFDVEECRTLSDMCAYYVRKTVDLHGGNIKRAAETLKISRATVYKYLNRNDA